VLDHDNQMKTIQVVGRRWAVTVAPEGVTAGVVCIAQSSQLSESKLRALCALDADVAV